MIATFAHAALSIQNQPAVEVLKFSWRKLPQSGSSSDKQAQEKRNESIDASIRAELQQDKPDYARVRSLEEMKKQGVPVDASKESDKAYEYKLKLKNTGRMQIISLKWAYVFKDAATGEELVRHVFESKVKMQPDQQKEVVLFTRLGPPMVVNAGAITKSGQAWDESVIIEAVEYSDGSRWARD